MEQALREKVYESGACLGSEKADLFFSDRPDELAEAQAICNGCEVRLVCLRMALEERQEWGVWGGVIFWDGQPFWRKRGRGRPSSIERDLPLEASVEDLWAQVKSA